MDHPFLDFKADAVFRLGELALMTEKAKSSFQSRVDKTIQFWKKAIDWGNSEAALELGQLYYTGIGVVRNISKAEFYWKKGFDLKSDFYEICGLRLINLYLEHQLDQIDKAIEICHKLLMKNPLQGTCYYKLYLIHMSPITGKNDLQKAMNYLQKGVEAENPECIFTTMSLSK